MSDVLSAALEDVQWSNAILTRGALEAGSGCVGDDVRAVLRPATAGEEPRQVDGRVLALGFRRLFNDREAHGRQTQIQGISTAWRDEMLHARTVSSASLLSTADAARILALALNSSSDARS